MLDKPAALSCGVLCFAIAALVVYGILEDNQSALLAVILLALPTLYAGNRLRNPGDG